MRQTKKITLIVDTATGTEESQHLIRKMKFRQFEHVMKAVVEIYQLVQKDEALQQLFGQIFTQDTSMLEEVDPDVWAKFTEEEKAKIKADANAETEKRFMKGVLDSFQVLLLNLPPQAIHLISLLSDIDKELLYEQEFEEILDVYDAVLEVNNIEEIVERVKKSLASTQRAVTFLNMTRKATAATPLQ